ncbi:MAG: hypothetical protein M3R47_10825, partial [Chloroflexota bacterium]|nr:hypothetical protein [Chloroflexota bacterium]
MTNRFALERLLARTGGRYLIIVIAVAQLIALLGAIPGILSISVNAEFTGGELQTFSWLVPVSIILSNLILLALSWLMTTTARKRLDTWAQTSLASTSDPEEEYKAWREITSLTWRYGIVAGLVIMLVNILPVFLITLSQSEVISSAFQPTSINSPAPAYVVLG